MTKGSRKPGEFCWINVMTPQAAEARAFFGKLLGWTYVEMPELGHVVQAGGHNFGALMDLAAPTTPKGKPPSIGVMVKVESADETSQRVTELGGKTQPPFDVMDRGRMAVCSDPNGAEFGLWQPKSLDGTDVDSELVGAPSWFENLASEIDRAAGFYSELFGWTADLKTGAGREYTVFKRGKSEVAGMLAITPQMGKMPPHWATYFTVKDAGASEREALKLGAKHCMEMKEVQGVGRFCGLTSPQGVNFFIIQYKR